MKCQALKQGLVYLVFREKERCKSMPLYRTLYLHHVSDGVFFRVEPHRIAGSIFKQEGDEG
ncbi:hypothetical protein BIV59_13030 [Bacillus sp. MUM 13]|nr:hypothetical protein BIV59_13030 [Bacillus sp. MUM 13]